ncbi:MAG: phosphatidate cytidylyltransferase [Coriobacteriia bacterium]|nr:phosphatidate cytidylyltransferase [Coriobacteriia bacterium]
MSAVRGFSGLKGFATRVLTAGGVGIVMLAAIFFGRPLGLGIVLSLIAMLAVGELYAFTRREHRLPNEVFGVLAAGAMPLSAAIAGRVGLMAAVTVLVVASLVWHVMFRQIKTADTAVTVFGAVYVGFLLAHFVLVRQLESGVLFALATILSVWANDVFAYLVGSTMGRHKMAPRVSPNKSWEGFAAGTLFTVLVWAALALLPENTLSLPVLIGIGLSISLGAVIGDLIESRLKREAGVKDSGSVLPGHGGFLDRFDSLILVSVVAYYLLVLAGIR